MNLTIALLVRQRARMAWNRATRGPRRLRTMLGSATTIVVTTGFVILAGVNAGQVIERVGRIDQQLAVQALPVLLVGVSLITLVTSLGSAFHHLFLAGDLDLLMVSPITPANLFGLKILEIWRDSVHVILFQAAALYGFGQSLDMPPPFYVAALATGLLLTLGAAAVGAMLTLVLARIRFGESILGLSRVLAVLLFLPVGVLGVPALGVGRGRISLALNQGSVNAVTDGLRTLGDPPVWAPTTWAAHVMLGDSAAGLSAGLLLATTVVVFSAMQLAFGGLFQGSCERVRFMVARGARRRGVHVPAFALPATPLAGILLKDWRIVLRDPRWRTGTLVSLVALGVPVLFLFTSEPFARSAHVFRFWVGMLPVPYLAFLVGSQQGASTLAYEGRNLALLRAAPVGMARILVAKVGGGLVLVLLVTWTATLSLGLSHNGEPAEIISALIAATWLAVGATVAAVAGAAITADFESDNPQRRIGCLGTLITSGLSMAFFVTNTAVLVWWILRGLLGVPRPIVVVAPVIDWVLPSLALLAVAALLLAYRFGVRRLATWELS